MTKKLKPVKAWATVTDDQAENRDNLKEGIFIYPTKAQALFGLEPGERVIRIVISEV